jgi:two-component system response regulator HydG
MGRVLLVDDDPGILKIVAMELRHEGIESSAASTGAEAIRAMEDDPPAAVVLDIHLPDASGKELLARFRRERPSIPVVMLTASDGLEDVIDCMRLGASDYVRKPFERTRLLTSIRNALERGTLQARVESLSRELRGGDGFAAILGGSPAMARSVDLLRRAAAGDVTLLLEGESGTGKEVAARAVHAEGERRTGPFVAVNCGAIPAGLIESELFGHEKGAFTGAAGARGGRFEEADRGTIFLDEIGELRIDLQVRLLRVLQERKVQRVGGGAPRPVDVRVVAATNRDLAAAIASGGFREDLYYRLAVFPVRLPPLREREGDVRLLAGAFLARFARRHGRPATSFSREARRALEAYAWPGNVRELENVVERAVLMEDGPEVSLSSLPDAVVEAPSAAAGAPGSGPAARPTPADIRPLEDEERRLVLRALEATGGNVQEAARLLGISRATIYRKLERYGLVADVARAAEGAPG